MLIAKQKRDENIAEYVLYMWQLEDILRAYSLDIEEVDKNIISRFNQPPAVAIQIRQWYQDMIDAMRAEGVSQKGHLMHVKNIIQDLSALNVSLIKDPNKQEYHKIFEQAVPSICEIIEKSGGNIKNEIDACFSALYGVLLLRLQKKEVTPATTEALKTISALITALVKIYHDAEQGSEPC